MGNALNVRILNNINTIAQGDTASTIQVELLDEHQLTMPEFDGVAALVNFVNTKGEIVYQVNTVVFDSRVEFNIGAVLQYGKYTLEIVIAREGYTYVFPSNGKTELNVNKSSSHYYTIALESIGPEAIVTDVFNRIRGEFPGALEHTAEKDNPHEVTAEQVGLERVPNWSSATQSEAEKGSPNNRFMTPTRTKQAIDAQIPIEDRERWDNSASVQYVDDSISNINIPDHAPYDNHLSSTNNPHNVTRAQVGLGSVPNWSPATQDEAIQGTNNRFMTPARTKQAIEAHVPIEEFNSHMNDNEVHVTPEDRSIWDSKATQTDIDNTLEGLSIPNKADFDQAIEGTNDSTYMTPFRVHQKVTDATKSFVQIVDAVLEYPYNGADDGTGGYGYYKSIPNFGSSVGLMIILTEDFPKGSFIARATGGSITRNPMEALVYDENWVLVDEIVLDMGSSGNMRTPKDLAAGSIISVNGIF